MVMKKPIIYNSDKTIKYSGMILNQQPSKGKDLWRKSWDLIEGHITRSKQTERQLCFKGKTYSHKSEFLKISIEI